MSNMSTSSPTSSRSTLRRAVWGTVTVAVVVLLAVIFSAWLSFHAKAEGMAVGYLQEARAAYQMGRPIPDSIFETGLYRVQTQSQAGADASSGAITVYVKDRFLNQT